MGFISDDPQLVRFIELFLRTAQDEIERLAPATAQRNINLQVLSKLRVPVPPPEELKRVVAQVDRRGSVIDELEKGVKTGLKRAERLRQSILARAFSGQLIRTEEQ